MHFFALYPFISAAIVFIVFFSLYKFTRLPVTYIIVLTSVIATILCEIAGYIWGGAALNLMYLFLGFNPAVIYHFPWMIYTAFTSIFVHGGFFHLIMNVIVLLFLCTYFESIVGRRKYLLLFLASAFFAEAFHTIAVLTIYPEIFGPAYASKAFFVTLIGASGGIFGIMTAFAVMYPRRRITIFVGFLPLPNVPLFLAVGVAIVMEVVSMFTQPWSTIAHAAHVGGAIIGGIYGAYYRLHGYKKVKRVERKPRRKRGPKIYDLEPLYQFVYSTWDKDIYNRILEDDEFREYWIGKLINGKPCPKCGSQLRYDEASGEIVCDSCGYKLKVRVERRW